MSLEMMAQQCPDYDMIDGAEEFSLPPPVGVTLRHCRDIVWPVYAACDKAALRSQRYHRALAILAAVCGTTAVLFAVVQLSGFSPSPWPMWVEIVAALLAFLAVVAGISLSQQTRWLLQRHKAERCRLLKFRFLVDPELWGESVDPWKDRLNRAVGEIRELTPESLDRWAGTDHVTDLVGEYPQRQFGVDSLHALVAYYEKKRLRVQMDYLSQRAGRNERMDRCTRILPHLFFFLSVLAVLGHFAVDIFFQSDESAHAVSVLLIVLAASFPALGAGIRTLRSAYEFARSACLFRAKQDALERVAASLKEEVSRGEVDGQAILTSIWHCEQFLEAEHREWLRLMIEAEWYM